MAMLPLPTRLALKIYDPCGARPSCRVIAVRMTALEANVDKILQLVHVGGALNSLKPLPAMPSIAPMPSTTPGNISPRGSAAPTAEPVEGSNAENGEASAEVPSG